MYQRLVPCPSCARHVRAADATCPFCAAALSVDAGARAVPAAPQRLGREAEPRREVVDEASLAPQPSHLVGGQRREALDLRDAARRRALGGRRAAERWRRLAVREEAPGLPHGFFRVLDGGRALAVTGE